MNPCAPMSAANDDACSASGRTTKPLTGLAPALRIAGRTSAAPSAGENVANDRQDLFPAIPAHWRQLLNIAGTVSPVSNVFASAACSDRPALPSRGAGGNISAGLPASKVFSSKVSGAPAIGDDSPPPGRSDCTAVASRVSIAAGSQQIVWVAVPLWHAEITPYSRPSSLQLLLVATFNNICYYRQKHGFPRFSHPSGRRRSAPAFRRRPPASRMKTCPRLSAIPVHTPDWRWRPPPSPH
jgi:hypothetical protein